MSMRDRSGSQPLWRRYLRLWGPDVGADVDDELRFHVEMLVEEYVASGMAPEQARQAALRRFGDFGVVERECLQIGEKSEKIMRRGELLTRVGHDLRFAARTLARAPGFALATVLVLALGIGANTTIFGVVNAVLLKPLPYAHPERLVRIYETFPLEGGKSGTGAVSYLNYKDWVEQGRSFSGLALTGFAGSVNLKGRGEPERLSAVPVDANLFRLLGARPLLGRVFADGEDRPGAAPTAVLGEAFWRSHLGADPKVIGSTLLLDGQPTTVIGVMPDRFRFPASRAPADVWVPLPLTSWMLQNRGSHAFAVIGRLKPGVTPEQAQAEMSRIAADLARAYPNAQEGRSVEVVGLREDVVGRIRPVLLVLLGAAGLVLLIACANAASLLLARSVARKREVAIRAALGAGRGRMIGQFLAESLLLASGGALLGLGLAWWGTRAISVAATRLLPRATEVTVDARVAGFLVLVTLATGLVFGLLPAIEVSRADLNENLREGGRGGSATRASRALRNGLVVAQIAFSLVLLVGAGLLMRTVVALMGTETGMRAENVLTLSMALSPDKLEPGKDPVQGFYRPVLERVRALPGVREAGLISLLPLQDYGTNANFGISGKTYASANEMPFAELRIVSPGYFASLGIPVKRGRDASPHDAAGPTVALLNQAVADKYFPGEDPVGQRITGLDNADITIVGVVANVRQARLDEPPLPEVYFPLAPTGPGAWASSQMTLVVRTGVDPTSMVRPVVAAIHQVDPTQPVYNVKTMEQVVSDAVSDRRLYLWLLASFALVAGALAVTGIYGLVSYSVSQRRREFGIRLALGSEVERVRRMVVAQGGRLAAIGLAIGLVPAYLLTRLLAALLYGVGAADPLTYVAVAAALAAAALGASYLPARRATRVNPVEALRAE